MLQWLKKEKIISKSDKKAKRGLFDEALLIIEDALKTQPSTDLKKQKLWLLKEIKQYDHAQTLLDELLLELPNDEILFVFKGELQLLRREFASAIESLKTAIDLGGENIWAEYLLGRCYVGLGDFDRAAEYFTSIIKYDKNFFKGRLLAAAEFQLMQLKS
ncbi:MAG: tetratricopeptide repeat protein [Bdellovibrionales bacterium]|nr:tetratricopeptide repeat protein [Bdellovibrionales bacterium]